MRRLRCACGTRVARLWSSGIGQILFIHCSNCNAQMESPRFTSYPPDGNEVRKFREALIERWKQANS